MKYVLWVWRNMVGIRLNTTVRITIGIMQVMLGLLMVWLSKRFIDVTIEEGLAQTADYMDRAGTSEAGHLIIFDRSKEKTWDERIWHRKYQLNGRDIIVWGM